jgi:hypothetical protein
MYRQTHAKHAAHCTWHTACTLRAHQVVVSEVERAHTAAVRPSHAHPVHLVHETDRLPAVVLLPLRAAGRGVKLHKRRPVRLRLRFARLRLGLQPPDLLFLLREHLALRQRTTQRARKWEPMKTHNEPNHEDHIQQS